MQVNTAKQIKVHHLSGTFCHAGEHWNRSKTLTPLCLFVMQVNTVKQIKDCQLMTALQVNMLVTLHLLCHAGEHCETKSDQTFSPFCDCLSCRWTRWPWTTQWTGSLSSLSSSTVPLAPTSSMWCRPPPKRSRTLGSRRFVPSWICRATSSEVSGSLQLYLLFVSWSQSLTFRFQCQFLMSCYVIFICICSSVR